MVSVRKPKFGSVLDRTHPVNRGVVGCWLLNEGSGLRCNDLSGNGNDGALAGFEPFTGTSKWMGGSPGSVLRFDGVNDRVGCGARRCLDTPDAFTVSAWVLPNTFKNEFFLGRENGWYFWRFGGNLVLEVYGEQLFWNTSGPAWSTPGWQHLVGTYRTPRLDGWSQAAPLPTIMADQAGAVVNGLLYQIGGYADSSLGVGQILKKCRAYDPGTNQWTELLDMPTARWGCAAAAVGNLIYVFGGDTDFIGTGSTKCQVYNTANNTWDDTKIAMPAALGHQGVMAINYGGIIHLFYGTVHQSYDPGTDTYSAVLTAIPNSVRWSTVATVGTNIYLLGGYTGVAATNKTQILAVAGDTWTQGVVCPDNRYGMVRENPVIGGLIYVTHGQKLNNAFYTQCWIYNPVGDSWTWRGSGLYPRDGVAGGVINNRLYVVGGRDISPNPIGRVYHEVLDPAAFTSMDNLKLYQNGHEIYSAFVGGNGPMDSLTNNLFLGSFQGTGQFFDGWIAEECLWNRALSAEEVRWLYLNPDARYVRTCTKVLKRR